jgi:hypothetical protein
MFRNECFCRADQRIRAHLGSPPARLTARVSPLLRSVSPNTKPGQGCARSPARRPPETASGTARFGAILQSLRHTRFGDLLGAQGEICWWLRAWSHGTQSHCLISLVHPHALTRSISGTCVLDGPTSAQFPDVQVWGKKFPSTPLVAYAVGEDGASYFKGVPRSASRLSQRASL